MEAFSETCDTLGDIGRKGVVLQAMAAGLEFFVWRISLSANRGHFAGICANVLVAFSD